MRCGLSCHRRKHCFDSSPRKKGTCKSGHELHLPDYRIKKKQWFSLTFWRTCGHVWSHGHVFRKTLRPRQLFYYAAWDVACRRCVPKKDEGEKRQHFERESPLHAQNSSVLLESWLRERWELCQLVVQFSARRVSLRPQFSCALHTLAIYQIIIIHRRSNDHVVLQVMYRFSQPFALNRGPKPLKLHREPTIIIPCTDEYLRWRFYTNLPVAWYKRQKIEYISYYVPAK